MATTPPGVALISLSRSEGFFRNEGITEEEGLYICVGTRSNADGTGRAAGRRAGTTGFVNSNISQPFAEDQVMHPTTISRSIAGILLTSSLIAALPLDAREAELRGRDQEPGEDVRGQEPELRGRGQEPGEDVRGRGADDLPPTAQANGVFPVRVDLLTPERGHRVGINGIGWIVDLEIKFDVPVAQSGFTLKADGGAGFQLTGPAAHNDTAPFPASFSPGSDERLPGLIVLVTTTVNNAALSPCANLANLFNVTGVTDIGSSSVELWDNWIVGAPNFGVGTSSVVFAAVAEDLDGDGIFNDAPDVVPDVDGNGICNATDLVAVGLASNIAGARFFINGSVDLSEVPVQP